MNDTASMVLIGIGTSGLRIARGVSRAFGETLRYFLADTDATEALPGEDFTLLGGDRLSGHGSGGDVVAARLAAEDSITFLDSRLEGVRLAVIVTSLGGGTGSGATLEALKRLSALGIPSVVFATLPFLFEGEDRRRNARGVMSLIEEEANATFFLPLDKLTGGEDNMEAALKRATDTVASGVTLFWRLVERPGYLRLDADRVRRLVLGAGRGRFATVTTQGANRAAEAVDLLMRSEMLSTASAPVRAALCGVLAGEDLRLSELATIADGVRQTFGEHLTFELGTVNDEQTFSGRITVVIMLFETGGRKDETDAPTTLVRIGGRRGRRGKGGAGGGSTGRGRFNNAAPTIWQGEDLDIPTFVRQCISLEF